MSGREVWWPLRAPTPLSEMWQREIDAVSERIRRVWSALMYGDGRYPPRWRCPEATLRKRAMYGGRKGRAAIRRLRARGCRPVTP